MSFVWVPTWKALRNTASPLRFVSMYHATSVIAGGGGPGGGRPASSS